MPQQILTYKDSVVNGIAAGFASLMQFVPNLIGALFVLLLGWLVSSFVGNILERVLHTAKFEHAAVRIGVSGKFQQIFGPSFTVSYAVGWLAKWFIRLIFIQGAANILAMPQLMNIINRIILFIPNLFISLFIMVLGAWAAQMVGRLVEASISRAGVLSPKIFSLIAQYSIMGFAVIAALNQIGIATNLISILFAGFVSSVALAVGLAFGLGGQSVAQDMTRTWYERGKGGPVPLKPVDSGSQSLGGSVRIPK